MKIRRFFAKDMRSALNEVKHELGSDAVIMSNKRMADGVEIVAAVDYDKTNKPSDTHSKPPVSEEKTRLTNNFVKPNPAKPKPESQAAVADSLSALLERQSSKSATSQIAINPVVKKPTDWFEQDLDYCLPEPFLSGIHLVNFEFSAFGFKIKK